MLLILRPYGRQRPGRVVRDEVAWFARRASHSAETSCPGRQEETRATLLRRGNGHSINAARQETQCPPPGSAASTGRPAFQRAPAFAAWSFEFERLALTGAMNFLLGQCRIPCTVPSYRVGSAKRSRSCWKIWGIEHYRFCGHGHYNSSPQQQPIEIRYVISSPIGLIIDHLASETETNATTDTSDTFFFDLYFQ